MEQSCLTDEERELERLESVEEHYRLRLHNDADAHALPRESLTERELSDELGVPVRVIEWV